MTNKKRVIATLAITSLVGVAGLVMAATTTAVNLGVANNFAIFGYTAVTSIPTAIISGDVGLYPAAGSFYAGLTSAEVTGTIYQASAGGPAGAVTDGAGLLAAQTAISDAYTSAAGRTPATVLSGSDNQLGGQVLTPGVYSFSGGATTANLIGTLTLDGDGIYVFQSSSDFVTAALSSVALINGAQACNVFWTIPSSTGAFGTGSTLKGTFMAYSSITDNGYSNIEGRLFASNGTVALNHTTVTKPTCGTAPSTNRRAPTIPPFIDIVKVPTPLALPSGPGSVTYNYTVSNVGMYPMTNVKVVDNQCPNVMYVSGDVNNNSRLGLTEKWKYSCTTVLSKTTTNTVTATGEANDLTAIDTATATVVVGVSLVPPLIHIVKVPDKFYLPALGGLVTYNYKVTNPGTVPLNNVSVADDKCVGLPVRVLGNPGDLNKNDLLESNEVWSFTCQTNIATTTTNLGTAEGHANGLTAIDFSLATVVVNPSVIPPVVDTPKLPNTGFAPENNSLLNTLVLVGVIVLPFSLYIARRRRTV